MWVAKKTARMVVIDMGSPNSLTSFSGHEK
jgi:hypothetical protein